MKRFKKIFILIGLLTISSCTMSTPLNDKKNETKNNLITIVDLDQYSADNKIIIHALIEEGKVLIDNANTIKEIVDIFTNIQNKILSIKTLVEELELSNYRSNMITELNDYINSRKYNDENHGLAIEELKNAINLLNEAQTIEEIDSITTISYEKINLIPLVIDEIKGLVFVNDNYLVGGGEILTHSLKNKTILVEGLGLINYTNQTKVYQLVNGTISQISFDNLCLGMQNVYYYFNQSTGLIDYMLINGEIHNDIIKVFINRTTSISGDNNRYHESIELISASKISIGLASTTEKVDVNANTMVSVMISNGKIIVNVNQEQLFETDQMILINPTSSKIKVNSISRSQGKPEYYGRFEIQIINNRLQLVNNVNLEDYLKTVVPSEMPSRWNLEALKAQAIGARTYALADVFKTANFDVGYHVDDSVMSQVYNNTLEQASTNRAILETKGVVMKNNGNFISAVFFSTSSSATGLPGDAWFDGINPKPDQEGPYYSAVYAKDFNGNNIIFDINSEASMLAFYKLIHFDTFEKNSSFHRWRYSPKKTEVIKQLQTTLKERFSAAPSQVLTYVNGEYISLMIPDNIGNFVSIEVTKRGAGGLITSIDIITSTHRFRVYKEYNIRLLFRNITFQTANASQTTYNGTRSNFNFLPSAYFAIEIIDDTVHFYGGGFGHGTGMSQYGANEMASRGYTYQDILTFYYQNIDFVSWLKEKEPLIDLIDCFNLF